MKITVHYSTKTGTIKQAFNKMFPYLKIEFFKTTYAKARATSWTDMALHNRYVGEINGRLKQGSISISGDHKVASVEQLFQQNFGLPVLVFRKQKNTWIETTSSDELTLSEQNEMGKESCTPLIFEEIAEAC